MSFPDDLLEQARYLRSAAHGNLEQVNLRQAVSASYYALFHLLTASASSLFTGDARLLARINRSFEHGKMKRVSAAVKDNQWSKGIENLASALVPPPELDKLKTVAAAFHSLQRMRHKADYDLDPNLVYTSDEVRGTIELAQEAFDRWREIEKTDLARLHLASFLLRNQWSEEPKP